MLARRSRGIDKTTLNEKTQKIVWSFFLKKKFNTSLNWYIKYSLYFCYVVEVTSVRHEMKDWRLSEPELRLFFLKDSLQQPIEKLNKQAFFYQKEIENLAAFGDNHYHKFQVMSMLMLNNTRKNEYKNKIRWFIIFFGYWNKQATQNSTFLRIQYVDSFVSCLIE